MAYFECLVGGGGKGNTLVITCDPEFAGKTITLSKTGKTYTKTCPTTSPYQVTYYGVDPGTYTVSSVIDGETYSNEVIVTNIENILLYGLNWKAWVNASKNYTDDDFEDLDDILTNEIAIRELMTIHACVDILAGITNGSEDAQKIIENDLCAKWINLSDYALDTLAANPIIKGYMDTADKYGYGEWALVGQVPKMTSNTTPYGVASASSAHESYPAWKAFDGDASTNWSTANGTTNGWISYKFLSPICVRAFMFIPQENINVPTVFSLEGSNDGSTWVTLGSYTNSDYTQTEHHYKVSNNNNYTYYRLNVTEKYKGVASIDYIRLCSLQFYAWQPKGNVPVMTGNSAPYGVASASSYASSSQYPAWKAFDGINSVGGADMWNSANGSHTNQWIYFKFSHPVCIKKVIYASAFSVGYTPKNVIIQGSIDGTTYKDLKNFLGEDTTADQTIDVSSNDEYFLYGRFYITDSYSTGTMTVTISKLQFYGRELSVSVPTMTGNTTPYGEASADSYDISSSSYPYYAFSNENKGWYPNSSGTHWLMYDFGKIGIVPKRVTVKHLRAAGTVQLNTSVIVSASNDNNQFTEIGRFTIDSSGIEYVSDNITSSACRYIKVEVTGDNIRAGQGMKFQFYGLDYSEKEFEEGTTKKWLYDHGVEVVAIDAMRDAGSKQSDCLNVAVGSSSANNTYGLTTPTDAIDLTSYSLIRAKVGKSMVGTIQPQASTQKTSYDSGRISYISIDQSHNKAMIPNDLTLDISSVNQNAYPNFIVGTTNMNTDIAEWWLE